MSNGVDVTNRIRVFGAWFLLLQGVAAALWWIVLWAVPQSRAYFLVSGATEATLWAFITGDLLLFVGGSIVSAFGLMRGRPWAWPALCVHAGAAAYAALYCLSLSIVTGGAWLGAALMMPSLVVPPYLVWRLRPRS